MAQIAAAESHPHSALVLAGLPNAEASFDSLTENYRQVIVLVRRHAHDGSLAPSLRAHVGAFAVLRDVGRIRQGLAAVWIQVDALQRPFFATFIGGNGNECAALEPSAALALDAIRQVVRVNAALVAQVAVCAARLSIRRRGCYVHAVFQNVLEFFLALFWREMCGVYVRVHPCTAAFALHPLSFALFKQSTATL